MLGHVVIRNLLAPGRSTCTRLIATSVARGLILDVQLLCSGCGSHGAALAHVGVGRADDLLAFSDRSKATSPPFADGGAGHRQSTLTFLLFPDGWQRSLAGQARV